MTATFKKKQSKMHNILFKKIVPFLVALFLGVFASSLFHLVNEIQEQTHEISVNREKPLLAIRECEANCGECSYRDVGIEVFSKPQRIKLSDKCKIGDSYKLTLLSKPCADYTSEARIANVSGTARLRMTFGANGEITSITPINELPFGLTQQAINAARKIEFEPEIKCGMPISVSKVVEYNFQIY